MKKRQFTSINVLASTLFLSTHLAASDLGQGLTNESDALLLKNIDNNYSHWNGIGKIMWNDEPSCTASLLDTRDKYNKTTGPAYLLTSAHCVPGVAGPRPDPLIKTVKFNYFNDTADSYKTYTIKETLWKDYNHTDLAIMELDASLATLIEDGITPLQMASDWASVVSDVLVVNAPERLPESGLRLAACSQEPTAGTLVENNRAYLTTFKNRCKEIRPGSSGSPVLDRKSGEILSVVATSTYGATIDEKCFSNAPCEVKNEQPEWSVDTHYSHPVENLSSCFNAGVFTSVSNICTPNDKRTVAYLKYWPTQYLAMPQDVTKPDPLINAEFSLDTPFYRFKTVRNILDCRSPRNYSGTIEAKDAVIDTPIRRDPGMHYLCVIGVESAEQRPSYELMKGVWFTPVLLIERNPIKMPEPTITLTADWNYTVKWRHLVPTHYAAMYYAGPTESTDCSTVKIADYIDTFEAVTFVAEKLPLTLCSRNSDLTGRYSKVRTDLLALP